MTPEGWCSAGRTTPGSSAGRKERQGRRAEWEESTRDAEGEEPGMRWQRHWDWSGPQPTTENDTRGKHGGKRSALYVCYGAQITLLPETVKVLAISLLVKKVTDCILFWVTAVRLRTGPGSGQLLCTRRSWEVYRDNEVWLWEFFLDSGNKIRE